jgi:hypothetical protein
LETAPTFTVSKQERRGVGANDHYMMSRKEKRALRCRFDTFLVTREWVGEEEARTLFPDMGGDVATGAAGGGDERIDDAAGGGRDPRPAAGPRDSTPPGSTSAAEYDALGSPCRKGLDE